MPLVENGASGNGGSMPDSSIGSYISGSGYDLPTGTQVFMALDFPADAINGDDFELSSDGLTVTFLTDGLYVVTFFVILTLSPDASGRAQIVTPNTCSVDTSWFKFDPNFTLPISPGVGDGVSSDSMGIPLATPPAAMNAGDTISLSAIATLSAGTVHLTGASLFWVTKLT
jgi:hypothetical protein